MKIVVSTRCFNEEKNVLRFLRGYAFADHIVISEGGSTDSTMLLLRSQTVVPPEKITIVPFRKQENIKGHLWNPDNPHINHSLMVANMLKPDWIIMDDMDCIPNYLLRRDARNVFETSSPQINAFRLYLWGENQYFPKMNGYFKVDYTSLWAWRPSELNIHADETQKHGTIVGMSDTPHCVWLPNCLLHKSWNPETIQSKLERYNTIGLPMNHPFTFAGDLEILPHFAREEE